MKNNGIKRKKINDVQKQIVNKRQKTFWSSKTALSYFMFLFF